MTLDQFLAWKGWSDAHFADLLGVSRVSVVRYRTGERIPKWPILARIHIVSDGLVTADGFLLKFIAQEKRRRFSRKTSSAAALGA